MGREAWLGFQREEKRGGLIEYDREQRFYKRAQIKWIKILECTKKLS